MKQICSWEASTNVLNIEQEFFSAASEPPGVTRRKTVENMINHSDAVEIAIDGIVYSMLTIMCFIAIAISFLLSYIYDGPFVTQCFRKYSL